MSNVWLCLNLKRLSFIQCEFTALFNGTFPSFLFLNVMGRHCVVPSVTKSFSTPSDWLVHINCCITIRKGLKKYSSTSFLVSSPPTNSFVFKLKKTPEILKASFCPCLTVLVVKYLWDKIKHLFLHTLFSNRSCKHRVLMGLLEGS